MQGQHNMNTILLMIFFSYGHCYTTYGPTNSAASPECLKNVPSPTPSQGTATLPTALLTLLFPLNALKIIQVLLLWPGHCYSTYGPTNSAVSPECLTNDPIPSFTATDTLFAALLTLLLLLNALKMIQFLLLWPLLLCLRP
jgi:sulfite exporter TauE/SafE